MWRGWARGSGVPGEGGRCRCQEGSDLSAEEGYEEGGPNAEEGHEEVWDEVQEALSTMEHEEFVETAEADLKVWRIFNDSLEDLR